MNRDREQFAEAGAPLCVIGQGTPVNAARFLRDYDLELDLLVDTDRLAYKAAGTKVGTLRELVGPTMVARGLRRSRESGVFQGKIVGHPAQLGGLMLVTPGGEVALGPPLRRRQRLPAERRGARSHQEALPTAALAAA